MKSSTLPARATGIWLLGLQHVLVMYAGTIAVPLIMGTALKLSKEQLAYLINADLFTAGVITIIQSLGLGRFGIRLPVMMGVTFATASPMIAIGAAPGVGLPGIFGAVMVAGVFAMLVAPMIGRFIGLFPPLVTGTIISLIGLSLFKVAINWCAGGQPTLSQTFGQKLASVVNPDYGRLSNLAIAFLVLAIVLLVHRFGRGLWRNMAVMIGLGIGTATAALLGRVSLAGLAEAPVIAITTPFHFGWPTFDLVASLTLCLVMLVVLAESLGMFLAIGSIVGQDLTKQDLTRGLLADGLGTFLAGIFNTFPHTSFSQNVGLLTVTGVRRPEVTAAGGVLLCLLGLLPKVAHLVASVPQYVLGGAGLVMFGMVAATGIKILAGVDYGERQHNLLIVAVSLSAGMIPTLSPEFFQHFPAWSRVIAHSGIVIGSLCATVLNVFFNGIQSPVTVPRTTSGSH